MNPEALIIRRCYPVPVTFADLRLAADLFGVVHTPSTKAVEANGVGCHNIRTAWTAAIKQATSALDEVYAVVDGCEVRVAVAAPEKFAYCGTWDAVSAAQSRILDLLEKADREGYWERPHEVRLDLSPRPVSHGEVARAVLVGQEALERGGVVRT